MRLVLSSEYFTEQIAQEAEKLLGKPLKNQTVALIPNAAVGAERDEIVGGKIQEFTIPHEMRCHTVDLEAVGRKQAIRLLDESDLIAISGGLVSHLMHAIDALDLYTYLLELLERKVFVTNSSGAMAMSKTQHLAEKYIGEPDPDVVNVKPFGVVDFELYPHFKEEMRDEVRDLLPDGIKAYGIKDDEAIIIDGSEMRFVGSPIKIA